MASIRTLELRVLALEARLADLERQDGETLYQLRRARVRTDLGIRRVLAHLGIAAMSDEEVDAALDEP